MSIPSRQDLEYHPLSEQIVDAITDKIGTDDRGFVRVHVAYFLAVIASSMRTSFLIPGNNQPEPTNLFAINLARSGFGKGYSTSILENSVIHVFRDIFINSTLPMLAEMNMPNLAARRAAAKGIDHDEAMIEVQKEYDLLGAPYFSFDSATPAAIKQFRTKLIMANAGSINLQTDEIGSNLAANGEILNLLLELFDGTVKDKLIKNTKESVRIQELWGKTPTNLMMFGVPGSLLDGAANEQQFMALQDTGYARRCFVGFVPETKQTELTLLSPQELYEKALTSTANVDLENISEYLGKLANHMAAHKIYEMTKETALLYFEYVNTCKEKANKLRSNETTRRSEMEHRPFKTAKLAATYAFINQSSHIGKKEFLAAVALAEDSGDAFSRVLTREKPHVLLAKHIAELETPATQADLMQDLRYYSGSRSNRDDMLHHAAAWGYKNNVIIRSTYVDSVQLISGETLVSTDLNAMKLAYSNDIVHHYQNVDAPFDDLHLLMEAPGLHWINHQTLNGDVADDQGVFHGYRSDEHCKAGFNMVVIDVDHGVTLKAAKHMLKGYKALYYTTKRHTDSNHRFRIIIPTNYELALDKETYKAFMKNIFDWLPFDSDDATGQRSRKWLTGGPTSVCEYVDGHTLDVLPFIPNTSKNETLVKKYKELDIHSLGNIERWVILNAGDGNRNNQLLRYAYILMENGYTVDEVQNAVLSLNQKLHNKLPDLEILGTIMSTIKKKMANLGG